ncbi:unnamed protein product [Rangifer tarandus platyrhynchus]|uniref:Uncharacterized protein n=1 Tax=Rangifer tarandus platyrhynchus TaxID=3082113 RepID=A0AC59ZJF6_RANTA
MGAAGIGRLGRTELRHPLLCGPAAQGQRHEIKRSNGSVLCREPSGKYVCLLFTKLRSTFAAPAADGFPASRLGSSLPRPSSRSRAEAHSLSFRDQEEHQSSPPIAGISTSLGEEAARVQTAPLRRRQALHHTCLESGV